MDVRQLYNQVPHTAWVSSSCSWSQLEIGCQRSENQLQTWAWALSVLRLSSPARMRKKCCYGQNLGSICSSLSPSPTHLSHTRNITLSRIQCERYIFIKKCVRSFIEIVIMFDYVQHLFVYASGYTT